MGCCTGNAPLKTFKKAQKSVDYMFFDFLKMNYFESIKSVVYVKGKNVQLLFSELVEECCKNKNQSKVDLCKFLINKFSCEKSTIKKFIYSKEYYPIYLIAELISQLPERKKNKFISEFNESIELMKFGVSKTWVKIPKKLSSELAWLCGAIAADGWISRDRFGKERVGIVDQNKNTVLRAKEYFEKLFEYSPHFYKKKDGAYWILIADSKIFAKFFVTFFDFHYGKKSGDVSEPSLIKNSSYSLDFISGVLCFDGSVELDGTVSLGCNSKVLVDEAKKILCNNGLPVKFSRPEANAYYIRSSSLLSESNIRKWLDLLGGDLEKARRLNYLVNGFSEKIDSESTALKLLENFVGTSRKNNQTLLLIFNIIKQSKSIQKRDLLKQSKVAHATLYKYLFILRKAKIINWKQNNFGKGTVSIYSYNFNIQDWRVPSS